MNMHFLLFMCAQERINTRIVNKPKNPEKVQSETSNRFQKDVTKMSKKRTQCGLISTRKGNLFMALLSIIRWETTMYVLNTMYGCKL